MSKRLALILCYVYCAMASCSYDPLFSKNRYRKELRQNLFLPLYFLYHNLNYQLFRLMQEKSYNFSQFIWNFNHSFHQNILYQNCFHAFAFYEKRSKLNLLSRSIFKVKYISSDAILWHFLQRHSAQIEVFVQHDTQTQIWE